MSEGGGRVTLWGIEVFLATLEEGALSAAAQRLGASASGVSQQLAGLESALGVTLFDRTARPFALTPAGQIFRRHAQEIVKELAQARAAIGMADLSALTSFRLGMIEDFDAEVTPRLLAGMGDALRGCRFLLETGASHWLMEQLDARALDIVVAADIGLAADWMETHPILSEPFVAVVAVADAALSDAELLARPFLRYTERHHMGRQIADHLARQNLRPVSRFEIDSYHALLAMVAAGQGWTILTPLGFLHAQRFQDAVTLRALPGAPLTRTLSLTARREVLQDMPGNVAEMLRALLSELVVGPTAQRFPFVASGLRVLH